MLRKFPVRLFRLVVLSAALLSVSCSSDSASSLSDLPYDLIPQQTAEISLFPGDLVYQDGSQWLLLSSYTLEHPSTSILLFSLKDQREIWRTDLPAVPVQALRVGDLYLVATAPANSEAYIAALDVQTGRPVWMHPQGNTMTALASDGSRVWVAWEKGISQIDETTGDVLSTEVMWEQASGDSAHRVLAVYSGNKRTYLAAAVGRKVFLYQGENGEWGPLWTFRSAGRVLELHPMGEEADTEWLVLAHSHAYAVGSNGQVLWRVDNSDYNLDGQPVRCGKEFLWGFRNVMGKVYLVNDSEVVRIWELPGGSAHAGPLPLPFPEHPAFGLRAADLDGDEKDELIVRSADYLFVFTCQGDLLAYTPIERSSEKLIPRFRRSRLHQPAIWEGKIVAPGDDKMVYFGLQSK